MFNAEWDAYPELRYFGGTFLIAQGCDPLLIAACDWERYRVIEAALQGKLSLEEFWRAFRARYLVARRGSPALRFAGSEGVSTIYEDAQVVVLELSGQ